MKKISQDSLEKRIEEATKRLQQNKAQLQQLKAQQTQIERKADARKKIICGAVVLKACESNPELHEMLMRLLDQNLVADRDRVVFGLAPKKQAANTEAAE